MTILYIFLFYWITVVKIKNVKYCQILKCCCNHCFFLHWSLYQYKFTYWHSGEIISIHTFHVIADNFHHHPCQMLSLMSDDELIFIYITQVNKKRCSRLRCRRVQYHKLWIIYAWSILCVQCVEYTHECKVCVPTPVNVRIGSCSKRDA